MVERVTIHAFEVLQKMIHEDIESLTEHLIGGGCKDYSDYKGLCGEIRGLRKAESSLIHLDRQATEDDDE